MCITDSGQIGIVHKDAKIGDEVVIFLGFPEPFVARKREHTHKIIGSAYLHGWMDGEALASELWYEEGFYVS